MAILQILILFYIIPTIISLIGHFYDLKDAYNVDVKLGTEELTYGKIVGRIIISIFPIVNYISAIGWTLLFLCECLDYVINALNTSVVKHKERNE